MHTDNAYRHTDFSFLGSSLNAVFNLEVTHPARFAWKTTTAFNEEPKKEKSPNGHEESSFLVEKAGFFGENCEILTRILDFLGALPVGAGGESVARSVVER